MSSNSIEERRLYTRVNRIIPISIFYDLRLIAFRQTVNISVGGILINTEDLGLVDGMLVEVELDINNSVGMSNVRIPAVVNWSSENRLALAFELLDKKMEPIVRLPLHLQEFENTTVKNFTDF